MSEFWRRKAAIQMPTLCHKPPCLLQALCVMLKHSATAAMEIAIELVEKDYISQCATRRLAPLSAQLLRAAHLTNSVTEALSYLMVGSAAEPKLIAVFIIRPQALF